MTAEQRKRTVRVRVARQPPENNTSPRYEVYDVERDEYATVLDLLDQIREECDSSLAYRYACRIGKCGICTAVVNGRTALTCMKRVKDVEEVVVEPPAHQKVLRDLVTERAG